MAAPDLDSQIATVLHVWPDITPLVFVPRTEQEFVRLLEVTKYIANIVRNDETHPLSSLLDVLGSLVEHYEQEHDPDF
jgi:HTH-type transcriptional regulator / antitoxin HigA